MELKTLFIADNVLSQLFVILTCTGNSFEVKIEADSSDVTDYVQDDKPRTNIGTKRSSKDRKSMNNREKQYRCTVCDKRFTRKQYLTVHSKQGRRKGPKTSSAHSSPIHSPLPSPTLRSRAPSLPLEVGPSPPFPPPLSPSPIYPAMIRPP